MPQFSLADFRRDLSPKFKLVPKLDRAIGEFDEEWTFTYEPKMPDLFWHPSGHCTPAPSTLYDLATDRLNGEEDSDFKKSMSKYGPVGHFWHQFLQHIMVRFDMVKEDAIEKQSYKGWRTGEPGFWVYPKSLEEFAPFHACIGSADVAPWVYKDHPYIVDFKTMSSRSFQQITLPKGFAAKYECQMNVYMDMFGYDRALIVAVNKDTPHDFKEFEFRRNQPLVDAIYAKWRFVAECLGDQYRPDTDDDEGFPLPTEWE